MLCSLSQRQLHEKKITDSVPEHVQTEFVGSLRVLFPGRAEVLQFVIVQAAA